MGEGLKRAFAATKATRKPTLPVPTEHQEQVVLFRWMDCMKAKHPELAGAFAIPNFARISARWGAYMRDEGKKAGVPDIVLPVARGGYHGLFLELKRKRGSKTYVEQKAWHLWLTDQGYYVAVCEGAEAAEKVILWYLEGAA